MVIGEFAALIIIVAIIAVVVLVVNKRETKVGELKRLRKENVALKVLVNNLDRQALAEYTVTNSAFAGSVLDAIRRSETKEIA